MFTSISFAPRRLATSAFVLEWLGVWAVLVADTLWAVPTPFRVSVSWHDGLMIGGATLVMLVCRVFSFPRGSVMAEYFALTVAATVSFGILSYLCTAHDAPLVDGALQRFDMALGFDWLAGFKLLFAHPWAVVLFRVLYETLAYQGLYFCLLMGLLGEQRRLREIFWLVFIAGLFTSAGALFWPALGPFKLYGLESHGTFIAEMEHLRSGHNMTFALHDMTGVVSFPSFHTTMALAYLWAFRRTGPVGWTIAAANVGMLITIPFIGGHYLTDMIAGAVVFVLSFAMVKFGRTALDAITNRAHLDASEA